MTDSEAVMRESPKRAAFVVASISVAFCTLGSTRVVAAFRSDEPGVLVWMALPLLAAITGMLSTLHRWMGPVWLCTGALFGFVIIGAWSLGPFYGYGALAMLAAALVHLAAVRSGWRTFLAPVWTLVGAGAVSAVFIVRDVLESNGYRHVTHAAIVIWGTWLFAGTSAFLLLVYGLFAIRHRSARASMTGYAEIVAWGAQIGFCALVVIGWAFGELRLQGSVAFLALWAAGYVGLAYLGYSGAFGPFVVLLDIALVLVIFKGDVRLT